MKKKPASRYALVSVYNKKGIVDFVKVLTSCNFKIISTDGTAQVLEKAHIPIIPIEKITGNPEAFDGRMKTINFAVGAGILFDRNKKSHLSQVKKLNIPQIDLVICNFYPEMIDIGGPTMVRAAAKNYQSVGVVVDPKDYDRLAREIKNRGWLSKKTRAELAVKAFEKTTDYEAKIHTSLAKKILKREIIRLHLSKGKKLRYGENPHQKGFFYQTKEKDLLSLANFSKIQGKETSFNNLLDMDAAITSLANIENGQPACVVIKHGNPCGAARASTLSEAFLRAWSGDSLAAFGSIIVLNRAITKKLATLMTTEKRFFEVLLAPKISQLAKQVFQKKKNLRVFLNPALNKAKLFSQLDFKKVRGGFLAQEPNLATLKKANLKVVTQKKPTKEQFRDLLFAWAVCKVCKSNSVVLAKNQSLVAAGVGQQDRKRCCQLAVDKAGTRTKNSVAASDGFFPFPDGPEILAQAGITAIIQPGGSIRDREVVKLCNKMGIAMVFTGIRCFRH